MLDFRIKILETRNKASKQQQSVLILVSYFLILSLLSCSNAYKKLEKIEHAVLQTDSLTSPFYGYERTAAYDTEVQFRKNVVSGLLFVKPQEDGSYRIALTAKMGMKIFDFTLDKQTFTVNHCIEQLNRKIVLQQLEKDLHLLTDSYFNPKELQVFELEEKDQTVYRLKREKDYVFYFYENADAKLVKIESGSKRKPKAMATFENYVEALPHHITLYHNMLFTLRLDMKWINLGK